MFDYLIVGAGFAGSVLAERLASQAGKRVLLVDRRTHIGGNAYDHYNDDGILIHQYGPHIFHTNSERIFDYLSQFTEWRPYEHRVLAPRGRAAPADPDQPHHGQQALRAEPDRPTRSARRSSTSRAEPMRALPHVRGRRRQQGRARALREVLPRLHAQAVGPGPVRAGRPGDRPRPDPHQHRRPLLHATRSRPCRCTATRACSSGCWTTRTSRSCSTPTSARSRAWSRAAR